MMAKERNILVISPHMDDETLGMGGTIAKHVSNNDNVYVCVVAHRVYNRQFDAMKNKKEIECTLKAKEILRYKEVEFLNLNDERLDTAIQDILTPLEKYLKKVKPDIVYSNFYEDNHQDHRAVFQAVRVAIRPASFLKVKEWYLYETPSSTDQSPPIREAAFLPNYYVDVSDTFELKIQAYHCYETEKRKFPNPRSEEAISILAMKRGTEIGFDKAEAFMTMRKVWI